MASDISNIIKSEIVATLDSILSVSSSVEDVQKVQAFDGSDEQCIKVESNFEFSATPSTWSFFIPTISGTKFEYLMLGGIADLKTAIDDEISDAVKEIVSTICGSIVTSVNAQGFDDIKDVKHTLGESTVKPCKDNEIKNLHKFTVAIGEDTLPIYISFDDSSASFIGGLTGAVVESSADSAPTTSAASTNVVGGNSVLSTLLGEDSVDNLRLLFDIKMRLSVRLGTKTCLLRDVISWDIGEIIELTQMTNEPLDILVNNVVIGQGEAVIVDGKFGVKIKHIGEQKLT